jgi:hypothetical protein
MLFPGNCVFRVVPTTDRRPFNHYFASIRSLLRHEHQSPKGREAVLLGLIFEHYKISPFALTNLGSFSQAAECLGEEQGSLTPCSLHSLLPSVSRLKRNFFLTFLLVCNSCTGFLCDIYICAYNVSGFGSRRKNPQTRILIRPS